MAKKHFDEARQKSSKKKVDGKKSRGSIVDKGKKPEFFHDGTPKVICLKCKGAGHYMKDCPTPLIITMEEVHEIHKLTGFIDDEDEKEDDTLIVPIQEVDIVSTNPCIEIVSSL